MGKKKKGDIGHKGGLINPRSGRGKYRAGFSNTGGSPEPRKRAPCQKKRFSICHKDCFQQILQYMYKECYLLS